MSEHEISGSQAQGQDVHYDVGDRDESDHSNEDVIKIRSRRKLLRHKFTRASNRLRTAISAGARDTRRLTREMVEIRRVYEETGEAHGQLYEYADEDQTTGLDEWEADLANDFFAIELRLEDYIKNIDSEHLQPSIIQRRVVTRAVSQNTIDGARGEQSLGNDVQGLGVSQGMEDNNLLHALDQPNRHSDQNQPKPFDSWIDELVEFQTSVITSRNENLSIADALCRLEINRDVPTITLSKFDGNPLAYVEFIEKFKIHVHNKPNLSDDMRMIQLKMHVIGEAERAISGLHSGGIMYATALKLIKDQFGHKSIVARAVVNRLTKGTKIAANDRQSLRDFSLDVINAVAIFRQMRYLADVNANENLRQIVKRLPDGLIQRWRSVATDVRERGQTPTLEHISDFIRRRVKADFDPDFGDLDRDRGKSFDSRDYQRDRKKAVHSTQPQQVRTYKCYVCQENHRVLDCPTFRDSSAVQRSQLVKDNRLCFSCLMKGHASRDCRSRKPCEKNGCKRWHHTLLHSDPPSASGAASPLDRDSIMPVVRVLFKSTNGKCREGNVLIDSGAGTTIIRKDFAKILGLQGKREGLDLSVVGGHCFVQPDSRRVKFQLQNILGGDEFPIEAHEIDRTIISVPALDKYTHLHTEEEVRQGRPFEPVGKRSKLGWFVIGSDKTKGTSSISAINFVEKINLEKFYQFETLGVQAPNCSCPESAMSLEDKRALNLFESSCRKEGDRYMIGLPWKTDPSCLPNNYIMAERRLLSLEKNLGKNEVKAQLYDTAIMEYESKGWESKLTEEEKASDTNMAVYYLPHHGVYRPDKVSTPLRVVFDPACQYMGTSLNSLLLKDPCLIGNLLAVLLRFREDLVAFTGDISKMFLQICIPEQDTHVHRFLWRNMDTTRDPDIYRLLRVTFGDKPSPDMASFVMLKIAEEIREKFPDAAMILERDRYVDDLIHSCASPEEACQRMIELDEALATGSFRIKEWICSEDVSDRRTTSAGEVRPSPTTEVNLDNEDVKTLGVCWNTGSDTIKFVVKKIDVAKFTKRSVLSKISMLFDPIGLASAVTIKARVAMQDVWRCKQLGWDDPLPPDMVSLWQQIFRELEELNGTEFPRCLKPSDTTGDSEIHVFADASGKAYGAVAHLVWPTSNGPEVRLISAKTRVAPLKQSTIPRLELMAALIASRLAKTIYDEFKIKPASVTLWSDSQIVLQWLQSETVTLKAFVGVRVAEIQSTWDSSNWRFVPTHLNPADDLSRGISTKQMDGRWKHGPDFLQMAKEEWPEDPCKIVTDNLETKKIKPLGAVTNEVPIIDVASISSWQKLLRVTAYCLRFINNIKQNLRGSASVDDRALQPVELEDAERYWVLHAQRALHDWKERFQDLAPFLEDGVIRVGGRLRHAPLTFDQAHPILLPSCHAIANLIMRDTHQRMGHVGAERNLCECRRKFWITSGRNLAKRMVRECVVCRKLRQRPHSTIMADLPPERLKLFSPPFTVTGVDLFGPFQLGYGRNKTTKAWGALFTCATTRAIHLEIVDGLSTSAFLHALRRFAAHHGWPQTLISDNGSNFVGAQAELKKLVQEGKKHLEDFASLHKIKWNFIIPLSPHQGGFYESLVKQTKRALQVAIGQQVLTWNEMSTAFSEAECLINSRPLGYMPNSPNDPQPITPNHFILGRASAEVPSGPFEETKNLHKRFAQVQMIVDQFWRRFIREYFPTLTRRNKWRCQGRQLRVGDVVMLTDPDTPRGRWNLGRILRVYPGKDGVVRNVEVKTKHGEYRRSVQRVCPILEVNDCSPVGPPRNVENSAN